MLKFNRTKKQNTDNDAKTVDRLLDKLDALRQQVKDLKARQNAETQALAIYNREVRALIGEEKYIKLTNEYSKNVMKHV